MYDQALENERNEYTKPNQYVLKYKYNHISGNDSSSTFDFKTINVKEKCTLSTKWTNKMKYNNCNYNYNKNNEKENNNLPRHTPNPYNLIFTPCIWNIPLWKERKTMMKWEKQIVGIKGIVEIDLFF